MLLRLQHLCPLQGHPHGVLRIETADYQRALDEILHQLQEIRDGHWEPWELEGARSTMRSALTSLSDSQGALENYCLGQAATGQSEDPETMQRLRDQVTPSASGPPPRA